jgi:hypothetical protein
MRRLALILLSAALIFGFFQVPLYKSWLNGHILNYKGGSFRKEVHRMGIEERKKARFGKLYEFCRQVSAAVQRDFSKDSKEQPLILLPPYEYAKQIGPGFIMPEPMIFFHLTGLHCTYPHLGSAYNANCAMLYKEQKLVLLHSKADTDSVIAYYNNLINPHNP